jgi:hypothetical protein
VSDRGRSRQVLTYLDHEYGHRYRIEYAWNGSYYVMHVLERPPSPRPDWHPNTYHLLEADRICVTQGREPATIDRAKAIAYVWMRGYSEFVKTGRFPNPAHRVNVPGPESRTPSRPAADPRGGRAKDLEGRTQNGGQQ